MKFFSRLLSAQSIGISQGKATTRKGKHNKRLLLELSSLCNDHGTNSGEIWISGDNRISFSNEIPEQLHQRLRNMINNSDV